VAAALLDIMCDGALFAPPHVAQAADNNITRLSTSQFVS